MTLHRFGRVVIWSLLGVFLLLLSLLAIISAIVATEPGSRWFVSQAENYLPIDVGDVRGNLLTGLDLTYIDYRVEENGQLQQSYRAENVSFRWQPFALLYSSVSVQSLTANTITLLLPPPTDAEPVPAPWPTLALPVRIELGQTQLDNIIVQRNQLNQPPEPVVNLRSVSGSLSLGTFNLRINDLAVVADDYSVIASGRVGLRYPYAAVLNVQWQFELPETDTRPHPELYSGRAEVEGDIEQLEVEHSLIAPFAIESRISFTPNLTQPPEAIAQAATPFIDMTSEWPAQALVQNWFPEGANIPVVGGALRAQGWIDDYQAELNGTVNYADIPPVNLNAKTRGDLKHINIDELIVQLQDAKDAGSAPTQANIAGVVTWTPEVSWNLAVSAADLDPSRYLAEWPGRLQLALKTNGGIGEAGLRVQVEQLNLHGQLRAFEVRAEGDAQFDGERWQSQELLLALGANHLRLQGTVGEQFDLQWRLDAPLLTQIDTHLEGSLFTNGKLQGSRAEPRLEMEARADQLRWQGYALRELRMALKPGAVAGYQLTLNAQDVALQQQRLDEIVLEGSGSIASHQVQGHIESEQYGKVELALNSGYRNEQWQGQFTQIDLRLPGLPRWWLLRSTPMSASAQAFDLGDLCLTTRTGRGTANSENTENAQEALAELPITQAIDEEGETAALCTKGKWSSTTGMQLQGSLESIPLRQLRSFLKPDVALNGFIEGDFSLNMPVGAAPVAQANLQTRAGELHYQYADLPLEVYRWENAVITANWKNQLLTAKFTTDWAQFGNAQANASLNTDNQQLAAKMHINFGDLAPLAAFLPFADDLSGQLAGDLEVRGTLQQPQLLGQLTLAQGAAKVPRLGLDLRELAMTLNSYGNGRIELRSSARSGEGQLTLAGDLDNFGAPEWQVLATVRGEKFQILDQPELKAQISPSIELRANQQEIRVSGDALIPSARAEIKSLPPTATRVSDDVIIEEEGRINGRNGQTAFYLNINAQLGDDVRFSGFGLSSRLSGKMSLIQTPTRPLLAAGYVDVVDGKYEAYGQELTIERGRLIFQGPYDNPGLDIRAQRSLRNNEDHIVGLEIGGTLQRPTSRVYSNPPLQNEGEAMALLLTGKPLAEASAGDAYAIVSAMSGMGMDKGGSITGQIADAFSLDEFKLSAEDGLEHSSLWVGKYLTDRLFVRYIVGLFDQINKVGVTYQMTDRLRIEGESGQIQSVDMIYKIER